LERTGDQAVISHFSTAGPSSIHRPKTGQAKQTLKENNMKRIVLATALVAASTFGAFAQEAPVMLSSAIQSQILTMVPDADLSNLTNVQYAQLVSIFSNAENLSAGSNPKGAVEAVLGAQ
jgi:hypothetical protein